MATKVAGEISQLKLSELEIFTLVARSKSVRESARRLGLEPGQVSKAIRSIERKVGQSLFRRSPSGVILSDIGAEMVQIADEILELGRKIDSIHLRRRLGTKMTLTVAATSFLTTHFVAPHFAKVFAEREELSFRFLDFPPDQMSAAGMRGTFEIGFHFGRIEWPKTWESKLLCKVPWRLCVRADHPISSRTTLAQVLEYSFVAPTYWTTEGFARGNDHFRVPLTKRKIGYETSTADASVPILLNTDHVAYLPETLIEPFQKVGALRVVNVKDLPPVDKELYISVQTDRVASPLYRELITHFTGS